MSASVDIQGFLSGLARAGERQLAAAGRAMEEFAAHVAGDSAELAPIDTGFLKASATWTPLQHQGGFYFVEVGHNASYAAAVHERLDLHHPQGQAKFLETALRNNAPKLGEYVAKRVREISGA